MNAFTKEELSENQEFGCQYRVYLEEAQACLLEPFHRYGKTDQPQEAMRYSLMVGGKRVRPILTLAFCDLLGADRKKAHPLACAVEMVHTYSLIHDDLPCMDDDDLRRGVPTCHKVYGEAMAVLAGDALQAEAFRVIASAPDLTAAQRIEAVQVLAAACGGDGMVAGQVADISQSAADEPSLRQMCARKTGAMIQAAAELGCIAAGAGQAVREKAVEYAGHLGLAFQVRDDMLDVTSSEEKLGKPIGSDRAAGKRTFVDFLGLKGCAALVEEETRLAAEALAEFPNNRFLLELARRLAERWG